MPYPLDHRLGYNALPCDVANLEPLMRDVVGSRVYLVLVARARRRPGLAQGSHGPVDLQRGQCIAGVRDLAGLLGHSTSSIDRALKRIESLGLIARKPGHLGTVITIVNYGEFSEAEDPERYGPDYGPGTAPTTAPVRPRLRNERVKERKRERGKEKNLQLALVDSGSTPSESTGLEQVKQHFHELYLEANGAKPTWNGATVNQLKRLIKQHDAQEVMRRAENMFRHPPSFPPGPYDMKTFEGHFDKFAKANQAKAQGYGHFKVTGDEEYAGGEVEDF